MSKQPTGRSRGPVPACLEPRDAASPRARHQITSFAADSLALKQQGPCEGQRGGLCIRYITSCCDRIPEKNHLKKKRLTLIHPSRVPAVIVIVGKPQWQKLEAAAYTVPATRKQRMVKDGTQLTIQSRTLAQGNGISLAVMPEDILPLRV